MRAWIDGRILDDAADPAIRVTDHGFTVGDGAFEALKVLDGQPFALTRHLRRLSRSARALGLPVVDEDGVRRAVAEVLRGYAAPLGRLRITYTAGDAPLGSGRGESAPTLVVVLADLDPMPVSTTVVTVPWSRNERGALAGVKSTSYAENVVALAHARARGGSEAIFANTQGHLCEGTGTNVFYVVDGELHTPTLAAGCLAGVTRELIVGWTGAVELDAPLEEIKELASEVFLSSTTRDAQGVRRWDERDLPDLGPVTKEVRELWAEHEARTLDP